MLVTVTALAAGVIEGAALDNANSGLVGFKLFLTNEAHIVSGHDWAVEGLSQLDSAVDKVFFAGALAAYKLEIKTIGKVCHPLFKMVLGLGDAMTGQRHTNITFMAAEGNQSAAELF